MHEYRGIMLFKKKIKGLSNTSDAQNVFFTIQHEMKELYQLSLFQRTIYTEKPPLGLLLL